MAKIWFSKGYKYQLKRDYHHILHFDTECFAVSPFLSLSGRDLKIRRGYAWDGASGPTWDDKTNYRGSLVHDALYQLMQMDLLPRVFQVEADEELALVCIEDGMWKTRARVWEKAVNRFGKRHTMKVRKLYSA